MSYNKVAFYQELIRDEGKRLTPYRDSLGYWTVGVGHLLVGNQINEFVNTSLGKPRKNLTDEECVQFLDDDIQTAEERLNKIFPAWQELDDVRQRAMLNLTFNLGMKLAKFVNFLKHVENEEWSDAATCLVNSLWWKQVGQRGPRIVHMIKTGQV